MNLAKSIVIEAAELLECFLWSDTEFELQHVKGMKTVHICLRHVRIIIDESCYAFVPTEWFSLTKKEFIKRFKENYD